MIKGPVLNWPFLATIRGRDTGMSFSETNSTMTKQYPISNEKFAQATALILKNGGKITTDNAFEVSGVKGRFERTDGKISITVTKKPMLARWSMIEEKLDEFFG